MIPEITSTIPQKRPSETTNGHNKRVRWSNELNIPHRINDLLLYLDRYWKLEAHEKSFRLVALASERFKFFSHSSFDPELEHAEQHKTALQASTYFNFKFVSNALQNLPIIIDSIDFHSLPDRGDELIAKVIESRQKDLLDKLLKRGAIPSGKSFSKVGQIDCEYEFLQMILHFFNTHIVWHPKYIIARIIEHGDETGLEFVLKQIPKPYDLQFALCAASRKSLKMTMQLVEWGANPLPTSLIESHPFYSALEAGCLDIAKFWIQKEKFIHFASLRYTHDEFVRHAKQGNLVAIEFLLSSECGLDINFWSMGSVAGAVALNEYRFNNRFNTHSEQERYLKILQLLAQKTDPTFFLEWYLSEAMESSWRSGVEFYAHLAHRFWEVTSYALDFLLKLPTSVNPRKDNILCAFLNACGKATQFKMLDQIIRITRELIPKLGPLSERKYYPMNPPIAAAIYATVNHSDKNECYLVDLLLYCGIDINAVSYSGEGVLDALWENREFTIFNSFYFASKKIDPTCFIERMVRGCSGGKIKDGLNFLQSMNIDFSHVKILGCPPMEGLNAYGQIDQNLINQNNYLSSRRDALKIQLEENDDIIRHLRDRIANAKVKEDHPIYQLLNEIKPYWAEDLRQKALICKEKATESAASLSTNAYRWLSIPVVDLQSHSPQLINEAFREALDKLDVSQLPDQGHSLLLTATEYGQGYWVETLLKRGVSPLHLNSAIKVSALEIASLGDSSISRIILKSLPDKTALDLKTQGYLFRQAILCEDEKLIDLLIAKGADINARTVNLVKDKECLRHGYFFPEFYASTNSTPLCLAAIISRKMTTKLLECSDKSTYAEAFYTIIRAENLLTANIFIERGCIDLKNDVELRKEFVKLFEQKNFSSIQFLLYHGLDMKQSLTDSTTIMDKALIYTISGKNQALFELCLKHGADIAAIHKAILKFCCTFHTGWHTTKLSVAQKKAICSPLKYFINRKLLDINAPGIGGDTLLCHALKQMNLSDSKDTLLRAILSTIIHLLFEYNPNPNIGSSCIPEAIHLQDIDIIQSLLKLGAVVKSEHISLARQQKSPAAEVITKILIDVQNHSNPA